MEYVGNIERPRHTAISIGWVSSLISILQKQQTNEKENLITAGLFLLSIIPKLADHLNLYETVPLSVLLIMVTSFIFILCEPGSKMTGQFEIFGQELDRCNWYALPMELQRIYMIFLSETQNQIKMFSYGNITCERVTSKKVDNWRWNSNLHAFCCCWMFNIISRLSTRHFRTLWRFGGSRHRWWTFYTG